MALSDFLNGYTSVSLYLQHSLYSSSSTFLFFERNYVFYVLHKKLCVNKKVNEIEVTLRTKIMWVVKKYFVAAKKIM